MIDTSEIENYLNNLFENYQNLDKVWLFGSRLDENTYWKTTSPDDWNLVVFTDRATMIKLKNDKSLRDDKIDLLVVYDNSKYYVRLRKGKDDRERSWNSFDWQEDKGGTKAVYHAEEPTGFQRCVARVVWSRPKQDN